MSRYYETMESKFTESDMLDDPENYGITSDTTSDTIKNIIQNQNVIIERVNSMKRTYKLYNDLIGMTRGKTKFATTINQFIKTMKPTYPIPLALSVVIGTRNMYPSVAEALESYKDDSIIILVDTVYVNCISINDYHNLIDNIKHIFPDMECKQLITTNTVHHMSFMLKTDENICSQIRDAFVAKFGKQWEYMGIDQHQYMDNNTLISVSNIAGTSEENRSHLVSLVYNPPDGHVDTVNQIQIHDQFEYTKTNQRYVLLPVVSKLSPYNIIAANVWKLLGVYNSGSKIKIASSDDESDSEEKQQNDGYVYLIKSAKEISNALKIGMSKSSTDKRLESYGKKSRIYAKASVNNPLECEKELREAFNKKFTCTKGREWFKGDKEEMHKLFLKTVIKYVSDK